MAHKNYARGRAKEYRVMRALEKLGYRCLRSAGSHGAWDVVAIGPRDTRLIQVKLNCKPTPDEEREIRSFIVSSGVSKELWIFRTGVRAPEIQRF